MKNLDRGSERVKDSCIWLDIFDVIKTITKFSNVIGHHQPALNTNRTSVRVTFVIGQCNRTVNSSCLFKWTERVMCARCCLAFRRVTCCYL